MIFVIDKKVDPGQVWSPTEQTCLEKSYQVIKYHSWNWTYQTQQFLTVLLLILIFGFFWIILTKQFILTGRDAWWTSPRTSWTTTRGVRTERRQTKLNLNNKYEVSDPAGAAGEISVLPLATSDIHRERGWELSGPASAVGNFIWINHHALRLHPAVHHAQILEQ